jgi:hypothetical protein
MAAFALPSAASAAQFITITGPSGTFGDDTVACGGATGPCSFTRTFSFVTPAGFNLASADISTVQAGDNMLTNIDFSTVTLNGVNFNVVLGTGVQEFRNLLNQALISGGNNVITVTGTTGGEAAFSGNLSFASVSAIPEPATWGMMLVGFGAVGYSMRRRKVGNLALQAA